MSATHDRFGGEPLQFRVGPQVKVKIGSILLYLVLGGRLLDLTIFVFFAVATLAVLGEKLYDRRLQICAARCSFDDRDGISDM